MNSDAAQNTVENMSDEDLLSLCQLVEEYKESLEGAEEEVRRLSDRVVELEGLNEHFERQSPGKVMINTQDLEETILHLDRELSLCRKKLMTKSDENDDLKQQNSTLEEQLQLKEEYIDRLKAHTMTLTPRADTHEVNDLEKSMNDLQCELQLFRDKYRRVEDELNSSQEQIQSLEKQLDSIKQENRTLEEENSYLRSEITSIQSSTSSPDSPHIVQHSNSSYKNLSRPNLSQDTSKCTPHKPRRHSSYTRAEWEHTYGIISSTSSDQLIAANCDGNADVEHDRGSDITHPYHPHHPYASSLWQAAVTEQNDDIVKQKNKPPQRPHLSRFIHSSEEYLGQFNETKQSYLEHSEQPSQKSSINRGEGSRKGSKIKQLFTRSLSDTKFTQPKIIRQGHIPSSWNSSERSSKSHRKKFTIKRNSSDDEGWAIAGSKWRSRHHPSAVAPARVLPAYPNNAKRFQHSDSGRDELCALDASGNSKEQTVKEQMHGGGGYKGQWKRAGSRVGNGVEDRRHSTGAYEGSPNLSMGKVVGSNGTVRQPPGTSPTYPESSARDLSSRERDCTSREDTQWENSRQGSFRNNSFNDEVIFSRRERVGEEQLENPLSEEYSNGNFYSHGRSSSMNRDWQLRGRIPSQLPVVRSTENSHHDSYCDTELESDECDFTISGSESDSSTGDDYSDGDTDSVKVETGDHKMRSRICRNSPATNSTTSRSSKSSGLKQQIDIGNIKVDC